MQNLSGSAESHSKTPTRERERERESLRQAQIHGLKYIHSYGKDAESIPGIYFLKTKDPESIPGNILSEDKGS